MLFNRARALEVMDKNGLEALVATTSQNVYYFSGFSVAMETIKSDAKSHQMFTVLSRANPEHISLIVPVIDIFELSYNREQGDWLNIETYGEYFVKVPDRELSEKEADALQLCSIENGYTKGKNRSALEALKTVLDLERLNGKTVGLDEMGLPPEIWDKLSSEGSSCEYVPAYDIINEAKMVKTGEEIRRIRRATEIIERSFEYAVAEIEEGITEAEIANLINESVRRLGGREALWLIGAGEKGALTDRKPTKNPVLRGDLVMFDVGCNYAGYYSDTGRTVVLGKPSEKQSTYYGACYAAEQAAIDAIEPGISASKLFDLAVKAARTSGISDYQRHHVGHGIGIYPYDPPSIRPTTHTLLEEGMVINIETPYYEMGLGGIQIEDTVLVKKGGFEYLTSLSRELRTL